MMKLRLTQFLKGSSITIGLMVGVIMAVAAHSGSIYQEQVRVTGNVTDVTGSPLRGVSVFEVGASNTSETDTDGNYSILVRANATLRFSYIGMLPQERLVSGSAIVDIVLQPDETSLDEVVVVGYGQQKKSHLSGAIASLNTEGIEEVHAARTEGALIGRIPGLSIRQSNGNVGEPMAINIRGQGSISAGNAPLIVVDGVIVGDMNDVNMADVRSIEVLKDASAAAIYGSRAAGGVLVITTRSGSFGGAPKFSAYATTGIKSATRLYNDLLTSEEMFELYTVTRDVNWLNNGGDPNVPIEDRGPGYLPSAAAGMLASGPNGEYISTDWQAEVLRKAPSYNLGGNVSGGGEHVRYYVGANYLDEDGVMLGTWYKRFNLRSKLDIKVNDFMELGFNIAPRYDVLRKNYEPLRETTYYPPYIPVKGPDGRYAHYNTWGIAGLGATSQNNPVSRALHREPMQYLFSLSTNVYLNVDIAEDLSYRLSMTGNPSSQQSTFWQPSIAYDSGERRALNEESRSLDWQIENTLDYRKSFGNHNFNVLVGTGHQKNRGHYSRMEANQQPNDFVRTLNAGVIQGNQTYTDLFEWSLISYFSRLTYNFRGRYMLNASVRQDGSSRFGKDNRWGLFPSISGAWNIAEESFWPTDGIVNQLKLRASTGTTGNFNIGNYAWQPTIGTFNAILGNDELRVGLTQASLGNSNLGWEKSVENNFGLDVSLYKNRLSLTVDYYKRRTKDLLFGAPVPQITGFSNYLTNYGEVENSGIELDLHGHIIDKDFKWNMSFNVFANRNKIISLGGDTDKMIQEIGFMYYLAEVGSPITQYYGYRYDGVYSTLEEIENSVPAAPSGARLGSPKFKDLDGNEIVNEDDREVLGSYLPKFQWGLTQRFAYKQFDLEVLFSGVHGVKIHDFESSYHFNTRKYITDNKDYGAYVTGNGHYPYQAVAGFDVRRSDMFITDASFLAIKSFILGYSFNARQLSAIKLKGLRVYASCFNPLIYVYGNFKGYNPEGVSAEETNNNIFLQGYNRGQQPMERVFNVGLNVSF